MNTKFKYHIYENTSDDDYEDVDFYEEEEIYDRNETFGYYEDDNIFYHGTTDKTLIGGNGIHVGTYKAAKQALEARIGVPANGEWDGKRKYSETKLAGKKKLNAFTKDGNYCNSGYNCSEDTPDEDYLPTERKERAKYSDGTPIPLTSHPIIFKVEIIGNMEEEIISDEKANELGNNKYSKVGYYYSNIGEDTDSISAVVPTNDWLKTL